MAMKKMKEKSGTNEGLKERKKYRDP